MFYTPDTLTVSAGQKITGQLSCAPNARNNRDLDITIAYKVEGGEETEVHYKMCVVLSFFSLCLSRASRVGCASGRTLTVCQVVI